MIMGAAVGFKVALVTANPWLAVLAAGIAGALGALIYCIVTVTFKGNQTVTGLALTILAPGLRACWANPCRGKPAATGFGYVCCLRCARIEQDPDFGRSIFQQSIYVQIAPILAVLIYFFIKKDEDWAEYARRRREPGGRGRLGHQRKPL